MKKKKKINPIFKKTNIEKKKLILLKKINLNKSQTILNYQSLDKVRQLLAQNDDIFIHLTENRVCNKHYFNPYIKIFLNENYEKYFLIYDTDNSNITKAIKLNNHEYEDYLDKQMNCTNNYQKISDKNKYIGPTDSYFIKLLSLIYNKIF